MSIFDMFKKKTDEDYLKELLDQLDSNSPQSGNAPSISAQGANTTITLPAPQAGSTITIAGSSAILGGLTSAQLQTLLAPLTKEEQIEMENLRKEHALKIKAAKLNVFKALAADIRQLVINGFEWKFCHENMNTTTAIKDPRLDELEKKNDIHNSALKYAGTLRVQDSSAFFSFPYVATLPEGLSLEDLKKAHMEATLEEQMVDDAPNS